MNVSWVHTTVILVLCVTTPKAALPAHAALATWEMAGTAWMSMSVLQTLTAVTVHWTDSVLTRMVATTVCVWRGTLKGNLLYVKVRIGQGWEWYYTMMAAITALVAGLTSLTLYTL